MIFPTTYKCLKDNIFTSDGYSIVPIRYKDRLDIMKWRNEQMYHLRQDKPLTEEAQEAYFKNVVAKLFEQEQPNQILFSYLKNDECIGYGGLVHINWVDKNAEISFIMNTELEENEFDLNWSIYLKLIEKISFVELNFNKIFTYAYDLRPKLFSTLEKNNFVLKSRIENHVLIDGIQKDVLIHEKHNIGKNIKIRKALKTDVNLIFEWSNDDLVRKQSYNSKKIILEEHINWYNSKYADSNSLFLILEVKKVPFGLIRFDIQKENATIGVLIDKKFRGKGLSIESLKLGSVEYFKSFKKPINAYIKESNKASIKAFSKAGFEFYKKELINESPSYVYQLKINKNG